MLRVAIVGCGKIADQHVQAVRRIPDAAVVAVCDNEMLMAKQLGERLAIREIFSDTAAMLKTVAPDVVHITTRPLGHSLLAKQCLESGSHVYVEKPLTVTAGEAKDLICFAEKQNRKITAGHNCQFTPEMLKMRQLIAQGFLGGAPVHLES